MTDGPIDTDPYHPFDPWSIRTSVRRRCGVRNLAENVVYTDGIPADMELIDTHAHLDDEQFDSQHDCLVRRAIDVGVVSIIAIGTTATSSQTCVDLARRHPAVFAAVGIQPNYAAQAAADDWSDVMRLVDQPKVVALGETGLDRHWDFTPFAVQQEFFDRHLRLSQQTGLPLVIHMRDCLDDILQMLREAQRRGPLRGVMHSFTGDSQGAAECIELGLHISFAGMITYKKSADLRAIAATIPADRIVIETDSPYLSPEPRRSVRPNEPAMLVHTARCLAEVRGVSWEQFAEQTTRNARQLFGLPTVTAE